MITETHAHYDDKAFDEDRQLCLTSLKEQGIEKVVNVGASMESSGATLKLCDNYDFIYGAIGVHPSETKDLTEEDMIWLGEHLNNKKVVAVGEIGLDYYWDSPERETQIKWFLRQLSLAIEKEMPVIIHSRDAAADTFAVIKEAVDKAKRNNKDLLGVIHCFSYGVEMAREYVKLGFYLGIGGVVTFKNAKKLKEVVEEIPLEWLVLETDCPYLSPEPNRGKRNDSSNLTYVAQQIADIKNVPYAEVVKITSLNARKLYRLK
jgi:TatD DNase family protein